MVLHNGRIVMEHYFNGHSASETWYWASAGKTLTATVTGIAENEGFLSLNNKVSDYLGTGWTRIPLAKENLITLFIHAKIIKKTNPFIFLLFFHLKKFLVYFNLIESAS